MVFYIFDHIVFWKSPLFDFYAPISLLILSFPKEYIGQKWFFSSSPIVDACLLSYFTHFTMVLTTTCKLTLQKVYFFSLFWVADSYISNCYCPSSPRCSLAISNLITTNLTHEPCSPVNSSCPRVPKYLIFWWYHIHLTTEVRNLELILDSTFDSSKFNWLTNLIVFTFQVSLGKAASLHELA